MAEFLIFQVLPVVLAYYTGKIVQRRQQCERQRRLANRAALCNVAGIRAPRAPQAVRWEVARG